MGKHKLGIFKSNFIKNGESQNKLKLYERVANYLNLRNPVLNEEED